MKKMLLATAIVVGGFGCTTPAPPPAPAAVADAAAPTPPALVTKAGERLKLRTERGADGSVRVAHESFFDTKFNEPCVGACGSDGKYHCLPARGAVMDSYYADKDCTQRLGMVAKGRTATHAALVSKENKTGDGYPCEYENQKRVFKIEGPYRESYVYLKNEKSGGCSKITEKEDTSLNDFMKHAQLFSLSGEVSPSEFVVIAPSPGADEGESSPRAAPVEKVAAPAVK